MITTIIPPPPSSSLPPSSSSSSSSGQWERADKFVRKIYSNNASSSMCDSSTIGMATNATTLSPSLLLLSS
jgi:hypothetical protein